MKNLVYLCLLLFSASLLAQSTTENYIKSTTYKVKTTNGTSKASGDPIANEEKQVSVQYFDGLGRPKQSISLGTGGGKQDLITHFSYDEFGRQTKEFLPYADGSYSANIRTGDIEQLTKSFYQTKYSGDFSGITDVNDINAYSEKHLESSPLNRVLEQAAPGKDWKLNKDSDTDHTIKFEYDTNSIEDAVRIFYVNTTTYSLIDTGDIYTIGELFKTITKDENWSSWEGKDKTTEEFKNKQGQVILKRTFNNKEPHDTYYVYDDFGNLTYVLPPQMKTNASISEHYYRNESNDFESNVNIYSNSSFNPINDFEVYFSSTRLSVNIYEYATPNSTLKTGKVYDLNHSVPLPDMDLGNIYHYDYINWEETIVGTARIENGDLYFTSNNEVISSDGEIYFGSLLAPYQNEFDPLPVPATELDDLAYQYKYDYRDRLVEKKIPGKGWEYIVYDKLDRPVMTQDANQRKTNTPSLQLDQWLFTKYDALGRVAYTGFTNNSSSRSSLQNLVITDSIYTQWESNDTSFSSSGTTVYYSNTTIPSGVNGVYTINYYDTYLDLPSGFTAPTSVLGQSVTVKTQGLPTVSKVRVLDTDSWITTLTYFDEKARPIYVYSENVYLNTIDIVESKLDFIGNIIETKTTHIKDTNTPIITSDYFEYDHQNRLLTHKQKINNQQKEVITANTYDELGQLLSKQVGGKETDADGLQKVDYSYNIRGWLKEINDINDLNSGLFSFKINYNDPINIVNTYSKALYNGNISQVQWRTDNVDNTAKSYTYTYDDMNRIFRGKDKNNKFSLSSISYDKNGNILKLQRTGPVFSTTEIPDIYNTSYGTMDNLYYTYSGNKLLKVEDTSNNDYGFKDGTNTGNDYIYDANGNMIRDENKSLFSIEYNHLNLPESIPVWDEDGQINYVYDATGVKLKKIVSSINDGTTTTEYAGNYIYENNNLQFFNQPEGYVKNDNETFNYVYQYKDHLGNVRLSYADVNNNGEVIGNAHITTTIFNDDLENSDGWDSNNTLYGISATITAERAKSGTKSVKIVNPNYNQYQYAHHNNWVPISNSTDTEYIISGWFYSTGPRARFLLFMQENGETNYSTQTASTPNSDVRDKWAYISYKIVVPSNIDKLNFRIDTFGGGFNSAGTVWFDDLKIERVDATLPSEIIEESNYYPFGLKHKGYNNVVSSNGNSVAQKFGFGGKELNDELGLNTMDFGARNYDASLGRFMNIDPLAEINQRQFTPYHYVKNNPIKFVDPNGMIWKDNEEAENLKKKVIKKSVSLENKKSDLQAKANKEGVSDKKKARIEKRIAGIDSRIESLDESFNDINAIGEDDRIFDLVSNEGETNHVKMGSDGVINIQGSSDALHIHEIKHTALSLSSEDGLQFNSENYLKPALSSNGLLDEIAGYRAQYGYKPSSLPGSISSGSGIDLKYIANLRKSDGSPVYPVLNQRYQNQQKQIKIGKKTQKQRDKNNGN